MALIHIGGKSYELVHENRNGWNPESFRSRYSEVLERYDFIIGDWGYNQLRLKGFFRDNHQKANRDCSFSSISDYINEYCNFGCAYFILEKKQGAAKEFGADDLDLNEAPPVIALDGMDLRAAAESAAAAEADGAVLAISREAAVIPQRNRHRYQPRTEAGNEHQEQQGHSGKQEREGRSPRESRNSQGDNRRRDKEHQHRKGNSRPHEHRGKKPSKGGPNGNGSQESASSEPRQSRGASHKGSTE
ncbi:YutD family protein [Paenibacillus sp. CAU 1782]